MKLKFLVYSLVVITLVCLNPVQANDISNKSTCDYGEHYDYNNFKFFRTPDIGGFLIKASQFLSWSQGRHFIHHGDRNSNKIALTFDDGPSADKCYMDAVLETLHANSIKATFFCFR
ncbi:MAG: polysaccharide deacetylase family protein [Candidatus Caenarcaniphilales bacterium]|nr:polysaccharide deacetylase family protein [Candidatus Caenarcaniphilales bacterium]